MPTRRYHLREAIVEAAKPLLETAGFALDSHHGDHVFRRPRPDGLVEAIAFCAGKYPNNFIVDVALVRSGQNPFEAYPITRPRLREEDLRVGVREPLGNVVHGRYVRGDDHTWQSDDELRKKVLKAAELAIVHGPKYWNRQAGRILRKLR